MDKLVIKYECKELEIAYNSISDTLAIDIHQIYFPSAHFYLDKSEIKQLRDYLTEILGVKDV